MKRLKLPCAAANVLLFILFAAILPSGRPSLAAQATPAAPSSGEPAAQSGQTPPAAEPQEKQPEVKTYTLPPDRYEKAVAFHRAQYRLHFVDFGYGVVVLLLVLAWRLGPKYRDLAERASSGRFVQAAIVVPLLLLTLGAFGLPTHIYSHSLSLQYGLSVQGWGSWAWDWIKGEFLGVVLGIFLTWMLYGVIRRSPRRWWFYFWLGSLPIIVFLVFIEPLVVDPLFFKFQPLQAQQPQLTAEIEKVVQRAGMDIPPDRMYEMKASEKLNALNAYVTGFGGSKRVVVWDTTMQKMTTPQSLSVFGHEMGHYVLHHIPKGMAFAGAGVFVFLYIAYRGLPWALARWGRGWTIRGVDDWASLPLLLLFLSILGFVAEPIGNGFSRYLEHQADVYGLEVIHGIIPNSSQVAAQAFQVLGEVDLSDPNPSPFIRFWLYDHPPISERVQFALSYDPWGKGESPQFVK